MRRAKIIGLSGLSGSGKTFIIQKLKERIPTDVCLLSFDDYYKPKDLQAVDENGVINFDLPYGLYHEKYHEDLVQLSMNRPLVINKYKFQNYDAPPETQIIEPAPVIIAEGLFVFDFADIDQLLDLRIFIETDPEISLQRRLVRDMKERGISEELSMYQWNNHVLPAYHQHILPHKTRCDLVIQNNGPWEENIDKLMHKINAM